MSAPDRETLGRLVHTIRQEWEAEQPSARGRAEPWERRSEAEREGDRRIGERLYQQGYGAGIDLGCRVLECHK